MDVLVRMDLGENQRHSFGVGPNKVMIREMGRRI